MKYWLMKYEPKVWSIDQRKKSVQKVQGLNYDF